MLLLLLLLLLTQLDNAQHPLWPVGLPLHPRLRRGWVAVPMTARALLLRSYDRSMVLRGVVAARVIPAVIRLLDGRRSREDIVTLLEDVPADAVVMALGLLHQAGLLEAAEDGMLHGKDAPGKERYADQLALFSSLDLPATKTQERINRSTVVVLGETPSAFAALDSLIASGVGTLHHIDPSGGGTGHTVQGTFNDGIHSPASVELGAETRYTDHIVNVQGSADISPMLDGTAAVLVCTDEPAIQLSDWVNVACFEAGIPWTSCGVQGALGFVGPSILPRQTACYNCFRSRRRATDWLYDETLAYEQAVRTGTVITPDEWIGSSVNLGQLPAYARIVGNLAASEILRMIIGLPVPVTYGNWWRMDFVTWQVGLHPVLKLPRCPLCGPGSDKPRRLPWAVDGEGL